jgi:heme oxygenase
VHRPVESRPPSAFIGEFSLQPCPAIAHLRSATRDVHARLESRLDVIARLGDPEGRPGMIRRYAALHIPADTVLEPYLAGIEGLDLRARRRTPLLARFAGRTPLPKFPRPGSRAAALGMLYVLEGSTLGGRLILRMLADRGISDPDLAFLDPYGHDTGSRWRSFLSVVSREVAADAARIGDAAQGALAGFGHAERVLCGDVA